MLAAADELVARGGHRAAASSTRSSSAPGRAASPSIRIGLATARGLGLALGVPAAGVSTLHAFAGGEPVIDARRGEVFTDRPVGRPGPRSSTSRARRLVGDGAVRYRERVRGRRRGRSRPTTTRRTCPSARLLVAHAGAFGPADGARAALRPRPRREADADDRRRDRASARSGSPTWARSRRSSSAPTARRGRGRCSPRSSRSRRSICLGAFEGDRLIGYVINSRYVDAWHVMNVAVDPDYQRRGIATRLLERLFELTTDDDRARLHARGARLERRGRSTLYEKLGFDRAGHPPRLLHRQPRGRADHVARLRGRRRESESDS